jgi:NitT/TauT family transport system substrate-binding protein
MFMSKRRKVHVAAGIAGVALALVGALAPEAALAQQKDVRVMMDFIIQGTHAPFFVAREKGYYKAEGLNVAVDAGKGGTNTAVSVASNVYQFGYVDLVTMVNFNVQNPNNPLIAVYMAFDETPLAVLTVQSKGIKSPRDLHGRKIAGGPGTAVHDTMSILLKAAKAEDVKIDWVSVSPALWAAVLAKGEVDGIGGFTNSQIPALMAVGFKREEIVTVRYSDYGTGLYGLGLITTKKYAEENPETVKGMVRALNRGMVDTIRDPAAALAIMKAGDAMMRTDLEQVRLEVALGHTYTDFTKKNGLSSVDPKRVEQNIAAVVDAYRLPKGPKVEDVWTDKFLPPVADRMVNK